METTNYISFILTSVVLILTPGPDLIFSLYAGLHGGKKAAFYAASGFALGNIVHLSFAYIGLATLLLIYPEIKQSLLILCALYLIYLAFLSFFNSSKSIMEIKKEPENYFRKAFVMNILNPKVILFFIAFFPSFLNSSSINYNLDFLKLGVSFILMVFVIFSSLATLVSAIGYKILMRSKLKFYFEIAAGILFFALAIKIILTSNIFV